jgi:hypothetical protein
VISFVKCEEVPLCFGQMGLPSFSVNDLEEVRLLPCLDMHVRMITFYFVDSCIVRFTEGFHYKYLKLKMEEIDGFASIEEKKLEDPYSINKCIIVLEGLNGIHMEDILMASNISKSKDNMEVFLSFTCDALRLAWIKREIGRSEVHNQN